MQRGFGLWSMHFNPFLWNLIHLMEYPFFVAVVAHNVSGCALETFLDKGTLGRYTPSLIA